MNNLLYDLLSRMPYQIPSQLHNLVQEPVNGFQEPESWGYIEARLLNAKVLDDYKRIDFLGKLCIRLTDGSQWAKKLSERNKDKFVKQMDGMLYITDKQVFFEGKHYHMCRSHHKITRVEEVGNRIRIMYGKKEERFLVQNPKSVLQRLMQYVDKSCLLQGCTYYEHLKSEGRAGEAELYERIYAALQQFKDEVLVDKAENCKEMCVKVLQLVLLDHPMLYYILPKKTEFVFEEVIIRMKFSYAYNQKQCEALNSALLRRISKLLRDGMACCGRDKSQLIKWLYTYLVQNASYAEAELESEEAEVQCRIHSVLGVFLDNKAVCDGMARALKVLLDELDVDNWIARRDLEEGAKYTHEWNMVMQDNTVLQMDATWERNVYDVKKQFQFDYFLLTEEEMQEKHKGYRKED